ncbi:MAG: LysM peptidoglycan-binding domain-containing protein [Elusimicrobiota bacterium]
MKKKFQIVLPLIFLFICFSLIRGEEVLQEITVKSGDTLWGVANKYLKDPRLWPEVLKYNDLPINDPNRVLTGMKLKVPLVLIKENLRSAKLVTVINDVQLRRDKQGDWKAAKTNMPVYNEDSLRTMEKSLAQVEFWSKEVLRLGENSLVILRPEAKQEEAQLLQGELRAGKTRIIAARSVIQPKITPQSGNPDFKTKIRPDQSTLVSVYKGLVDVTAEGKTVTVPEGFSTEVKLKLPPSALLPLPPAPDLEISQLETKQSSIKILTSPQVKFSADSKMSKNTRWHLQVSKDEAFKQIVLDKTADKEENFPDFSQQLADGDYFLRLSSIDQLGWESKYSPLRKISIDKTAPQLEISSPQDSSKTTDYKIKVIGKTDPEAQIFINEEKTTVGENGEFRTELLLGVGINLIRIKAVDGSGNQTEKKLAIEQVSTMSIYNGFENLPKEDKPAKSKWSMGNITMSIVSGAVIVYVIMAVIP